MARYVREQEKQRARDEAWKRFSEARPHLYKPFPGRWYCVSPGWLSNMQDGERLPEDAEHVEISENGEEVRTSYTSYAALTRNVVGFGDDMYEAYDAWSSSMRHALSLNSVFKPKGD